jgi:hypothetical protein
LGTAFKIDRKSLSEHLSGEDFVFFPHVLSKNVVFEVNFGQRVSLIGDEPFAPIKSDYKLIQKLPLEQRIGVDARSMNKKDYEVVMLIGLPGVGKTRWAMEHAKRNPKKNYYIIGVASVLEKVTVREVSSVFT